MITGLAAASSLVTELRGAVPRHFEAIAEGDTVVVRNTTTGEWTASYLSGIESEDLLCALLQNALSGIQDFIVTEIHKAWRSPLNPDAGPSYIPLPHVVFRDGRLRVWFGDPDAPDLVLLN